MKRIIIILILFQFCNSSLIAQSIKLSGYISPRAGANNPSHIDSLGKGGFMVVSSKLDRDSIPLDRRKFGMLVFVQNNNTLYQLKDSASAKLYSDSTDWLSIGLNSSVDVDKFLKYAKTSDSLYIKGNTLIGNTLKIDSTSSSADSVQYAKNRVIDSANSVRLVVGGGVRIDSSVYIGGGLRIGGKLIIDSGLTFKDSLIVARGARIDSSLLVKGKIIINDSLLAKSNALIGSTLQIDSSSIRADSLQYAKNKEIDSVNSVRLVVGGGVRIDSSLYVNKDLEINGNLILNTGLKFNDSLIVTKGARIDSSLILKGKLYLGDSLIAKEKALIGSILTLDSTSSSADSVQYEKNRVIDSANSVRLVVGGGVRIDSSVYIRGNFRLGGDLILDSGLFRENFVVNLGEGVKFGRYNYKDTIQAKGKTIDQVFYEILTDITHPLYLQPRLKILYLPTIDETTTDKVLRYEIGDTLGLLQFSSNFIQNNAGERITTTYKQNGLNFSSYPDSTVNITALTDTLYYTSSILYDTGAVLINRIGVTDSTGIILKGTIVSDTISIIPISKNYWGYSLYADTLNISDSLMLGLDSTSGKGFSDFANSASKTSFTIPITGGENYIYYAYPASYPDLTSIMVGPFESVDAFTKIIRNVVNAQGYTQAYKIYVSINNFSDKVEKIVIN